MKKILVLGILALTAATAFATQGGLHIIKKIAVPGEGWWDCLTLDSKGRRLYISHGTQVDVLNVDNGKLVGAIPNTDGVHDIAIATELGRGFTSNGRASTVSIFDLKSLKRRQDD